jgi:hypothetical protein
MSSAYGREIPEAYKIEKARACLPSILLADDELLQVQDADERAQTRRVAFVSFEVSVDYYLRVRVRAGRSRLSVDS